MEVQRNFIFLKIEFNTRRIFSKHLRSAKISLYAVFLWLLPNKLHIGVTPNCNFRTVFQKMIKLFPTISVGQVPIICVSLSGQCNVLFLCQKLLLRISNSEVIFKLGMNKAVFISIIHNMLKDLLGKYIFNKNKKLVN